MRLLLQWYTAFQVTAGIMLAVDAAKGFGSPTAGQILSAFLALVIFWSVINRLE